jgi:imidazolonepropionase-like amidohydrolase
MQAARIAGGALGAVLLAAACGSPGWRVARADSRRAPRAIAPLAPGESGVALTGARILTMDGEDRILERATLVVRGGVIEALGGDLELPQGFPARDCGGLWLFPGMVDLHTHIHAGPGFGDINDMALPLNQDLRASAALVPANANVRRACAAGVTTLFGIPGSGTSTSGFGVVYKSKTSGGYGDVVVRDPGGMKVAQTHNPERRAGDFGATRAGLGWLLTDLNERTLAQMEAGAVELGYQNLARVHAGELPVLIHCAASDGVANAARMWKGRYDTNCVVSHGCFDAWKIAPYVRELGVPMNAGPRTIDFVTTREGRYVGIADVYQDQELPLLSLNTDSPVVPEEELFLQGAMSARFGADAYPLLRSLTTNPAQSFDLGERVGSLEPGKDADLAAFSGDPLDPRSRVEFVLIDGELQYDRARDGQWF